MRKIIEELIKIIEESQGDQETVEKKINEYYANNQSIIAVDSEQFNRKLEQATKEIDASNNFGKVMENIFKLMTDEIGEDNFKKLMELQEKYPYLKDITKKIMPDK